MFSIILSLLPPLYNIFPTWALVPSRFLYYTDIIKSKEGTLMTKQEISEIKKLFTPKNCSITRICGCYVDGEKNKKTELKQAFLALPEEEMFKYFEILRKASRTTDGRRISHPVRNTSSRMWRMCPAPCPPSLCQNASTRATGGTISSARFKIMVGVSSIATPPHFCW